MVERPPGNHLNFPIQIHFEVFLPTEYFESFECYYKFNSHFRFQKELTIQHLDFELFPSNIIFIYSASKMREHTIQLLNVLSLVYKLANCNFQWHERHPINVLNWTEAKKNLSKNIYMSIIETHWRVIWYIKIRCFYRMEFFNIFSTNLKPNISIIKICLQFSELEAIYCQTHWMSIATEFSLCSRTFESIQIMHACHEHECSVSSRNEWHNLLRESELFSNQSQGKNMDWHCGSFHR